MMGFRRDLPESEDLNKSMNQSMLTTHEVGITDLLVQALVIELNDSINGIAQTSLQQESWGLKNRTLVWLKPR